MRKGYRLFLFAVLAELLIIGFCILRTAGSAEKKRAALLGLREELTAEETADREDPGQSMEDTEADGSVCSGETGEEQTKEEQQTAEKQSSEGEEPVVRVRITDSDYVSEYHSTVTVSCEKTFSLTTGEKSQIFTGGQTVSIGMDHPFFAEGSIRIEAQDGLLRIDSVAHRGQTNTYQGILDLYLTDKGIVMINELPLEAYVEGVVPSEMPSGYGAEAARLQAVCARTYAYQRIVSGAADAYGAIADDSVEYQVYNASPKREVSTEAVSETRGVILTYQGVPLTPYYFSTSCGFNADNTVWGGERLPYLRTQNLSYRADIDLQSEEVFDAFIKDWDYPAYEDDCTWYRWNYTISLEELKTILQERISALYSAESGHFHMTDKNGTEQPIDVAFLNGLREVRVTKRFSGGMAGEAAFVCDQAVIYADGEMVLRKLLGSPSRLYTNQSAEGFGESEGSYLPSAFFCLSAIVEGETVTGYTICGGGNGHGIGLSQNAAYAMLQSGLTWEEVLQFFYLGTALEQVY